MSCRAALGRLTTAAAIMALAAYSAAGCNNQALAADERGPDITYKTGVAVGRIGVVRDAGTTATYTIGGVPIGAALNHDFSHRVTGSFGGQVLLDVINREMLRQGVEAGVSYHLLGGSRRLEYSGDRVSVAATSNSSVSLTLMGGLYNYAASVDNGAVSFNGSVFETKAGFEYRRDRDRDSSWGAALLSTLFTMPASVNHLKPRVIELMFFLRN